MVYIFSVFYYLWWRKDAHNVAHR